MNTLFKSSLATVSKCMSLIMLMMTSSSSFVASFTVVNNSNRISGTFTSSSRWKHMQGSQKRSPSSPSSPTTTQTHMVDFPIDDIITLSTTTTLLSSYSTILESTSTFLSTISADIDNIPDDNFGLVFAGGITVMIGGVFSALMVGFLLESGDSYASVVADSYAQGGDEEFWDSLSPEDQVKAKELIAKLKASKEGGAGGGEGTSSSSSNIVDDSVLVGAGGSSSSMDGGLTPQGVKVGEEKKSSGKKAEAVSMFSDYDD